jgi:hypothetical protein
VSKFRLLDRGGLTEMNIAKEIDEGDVSSVEEFRELVLKREDELQRAINEGVDASEQLKEILNWAKDD